MNLKRKLLHAEKCLNNQIHTSVYFDFTDALVHYYNIEAVYFPCCKPFNRFQFQKHNSTKLLTAWKTSLILNFTSLPNTNL